MALRERDPVRAFGLYEAACELGVGAACVSLAKRLAEGEGMERDLARAEGLFRAVCEAAPEDPAEREAAAAEACTWLMELPCRSGDAASCRDLGHRYNAGNGVPPDRERALVWLRRACDIGEGRECLDLANVLSGEPEDRALATPLYQRLCEEGNGEACVAMAWRYNQGIGTSIDQERATALYRELCEGGIYTYLCVAAGERFLEGIGVVADASRAASYFVEGCMAANWVACAMANRMHRRGIGVPRNRAADFGRALPVGPVSVLWERGRLHRDGHDLPKDLARARQLFQQACDEGEGLGCLELAADASPGAAPGDQRAAKLLVRARRLLETNCQADIAPACHALAGMLLEGIAGPRDENRGREIIDGLCEAWRNGGSHFPECGP